jgi:predicted nucleotidyltransferase
VSTFHLLAVLHRHGVEFIVIGAFAAVAQGYPLPTQDVDITPSRDPVNLERLAAALSELRAELRLPGGTTHPFPIEPRYLGDSDSWTLATAAGDLDVHFRPGGTNGFDDLRRDAIEVTLRGTPVRLASLRDVIRMKEATGREKDQAQLPALRRTLELRRRREAEEP